MGGAQMMEKFLGTTLKSWLEARERVVRRWIRRKQIQPINPRALLYLIWATTQHYADFERQMTLLNDGRQMTDAEFEARTRQVVRLVLGSVGIHGQEA